VTCSRLLTCDFRIVKSVMDADHAHTCIYRSQHELEVVCSGQEALEAAHQKDCVGKAPEAIKTYRIGSQIIDEGLRLDVPSVGLGPAFSNTARWRADLTTWRVQAANRSACSLL
jgi:hypothetical protein